MEAKTKKGVMATAGGVVAAAALTFGLMQVAPADDLDAAMTEAAKSTPTWSKNLDKQINSAYEEVKADPTGFEPNFKLCNLLTSRWEEQRFYRHGGNVPVVEQHLPHFPTPTPAMTILIKRLEDVKDASKEQSLRLGALKYRILEAPKSVKK